MKIGWIAIIAGTCCISCQRDEPETEVSLREKPTHVPFAIDKTKPKSSKHSGERTTSTVPSGGKAPETDAATGLVGTSVDVVAEEVDLTGEVLEEEAVVEEAGEPQVPQTAPVALAVPGSPNMVYSPYDNRLIDVRGLYAGSIVQDPGSPAGAPRYFAVPVILYTPPPVVEEVIEPVEVIEEVAE